MTIKPTIHTIKRLGWIPDHPDHRDLLFTAIAPKLKALPASTDLRPKCSAVEDQGNLGSCTANALVGAMEYVGNKNGVPFVDLSRLFLYYNERRLIGTITVDSGAYLRDGIKSLVKEGVCKEVTCPYKIADFAKKPSTKAYTEALKRQVLSYYRLNLVDEMKACLADGFPFAFGFSVYDSFMSASVQKTGTVNLPKPTESLQGGHAVLAVGYNDAKQRFLVRNSWGPNWGDKGYFTMPYAYLANRNLSDDFWTIRGQETGALQVPERQQS